MLVDVHKRDADGNVFTLKEPWGIALKWKGKSVYVPCGFKSDGCSVPRLFWRVVFPSSDTRALRAGIVHDYIYRNHPEGWTKFDADLLFYELLRHDGVRLRRALLAYLGVLFFGFIAWKRGNKHDESKTA